ncbi:MAG: hypothetical protein RMJ54_15020 [Roseiflexaceae bacterium]|nr:hypothetical protein [Roseiflexaceae bacterium]
MARLRQIGSVQDALGALTIGDGYLLRSDRVAVALIELTPPDLRLHDADSLTRLLAQTLGDAQQRAPDFQSYAILGALTDWLAHAWSSLMHLRAVRWIVTVPSIAPELPPSGTWGELLPAAIVGQTTRLAGDPVEEALARARRLLSQFAALGMELPPHAARGRFCTAIAPPDSEIASVRARRNGGVDCTAIAPPGSEIASVQARHFRRGPEPARPTGAWQVQRTASVWSASSTQH